MTKYYEVTIRDGAARKGKLMLKQELQTPHVINHQTILEKTGPIISMGSSLGYDSTEEMQNAMGKNCNQEKLVILPYDPTDYAIPQGIGTPDETPIGIVTLNGEGTSVADMYVIANTGRMSMSARNLISIITNIRENTAPDTALYAPAYATPENLSLLIYLGVDLVDDTQVVFKALQDIYLTREGEHPLEQLHDAMCTCEVCENSTPQELLSMDKEKRAEKLAQHNRHQLQAEMKTVREKIRNGRIREYVEKQCRNNVFLMAALRHLDQEQTYLERRTPIARDTVLLATSMESMHRVEVTRFASRVRERYRFGGDADVLLLLPCSARKPYSTSKSHRLFARALKDFRTGVHEVIITSPLGVVPRELELVYPAAHYDVPVTGYWDEEEKRWVSGCIRNYLVNNGGYKHVVAHVDDVYRSVIEHALASDVDVIFTCVDGKVTSGESLDNLGKVIKELRPDGNLSREQRAVNMLRAICSYQLGTNAADKVFAGQPLVKGRFPRYRIYDQNVQLAALVPEYGLLALTLEGGTRLKDLDAYQVQIDDFVPIGSVLAPGVLEADSMIRVGDEVLIAGDKVFGVGRAHMNGWEMERSTRGVAVDVRHVMEV